MKEYSKVIYMKFKPEEVEILHDRMKEAGVQNMSAYIRKIQKRESELIKSVSVVLRFIRSSRGLGRKTSGGRLLCADRSGTETSTTSKNAPGIYRGTACQFAKKKGFQL